jgi:hypothetical protein
LITINRSTTLTFKMTSLKSGFRSASPFRCALPENQAEKSTRKTRSANQIAFIAPLRCQLGHLSTLRCSI